VGTIPTNTLITILDSLASGKLIFDNAVGVLGTESNTVSKAALNDTVTLAAIADAEVLSDLMPSFKMRDDTLLASGLYAALGAADIWWALDKHVANSSQVGVINLDTYMQVNNIRASTHVQQMGFPLAPEQVMSPAVDPMATYTVTGSGSGTYAHVADIDTTQYGRAWLQAVVTATIGTIPITATINGLQFDATSPTIKQITISANSSVGTTVNIGVMGVQGDSYGQVTSIQISGGTSGDAFKVRSRVERTISAVS